MAVLEVEARVVDHRLVGLHGALVLVDEVGLGVGLLLRDRVLLGEGAVAGEVDLGVVQQGGVADELALGLVERDLVGAGIDLGEEVARPHDLSFLESDRDQAPRDLRLHGHGGEWADRAEGVERDREIALDHRRSHHRYRGGAAARPRIRRCAGMDEPRDAGEKEHDCAAPGEGDEARPAAAG